MMRRWFLLVLVSVLSLGAVHAQNWALLNPTYKYNYSKDGSDTISNQIFVTHIDTLGVDSFRYELNRIGVVCDTCPASLGGPCDGCFVWADQPQFLRRSVIVGTEGWYFVDPDTIFIRTQGEWNEPWPFLPDSSILGVASPPVAATVLGVEDSVRTISLSDGSAISISKAFGILTFPAPGSNEFSLIGIHGPDIGRLIPEPLDYFDFQPGDIIGYRMGQVIGTQFPPEVDWQKYWRVIIETRTDVPGGILFTYDLDIEYFLGVGATTPLWLDQSFSGTWLLLDSVLRAYHPLLASYPGELVDWACAMYPTSINGPFSRRVLAEHRIDPTGHYRVQAQRTEADSWCSSTGRSVLHDPYEVLPGLYSFDDVDCVDLWYEQGTGVIVHDDFGFEWSCGLRSRLEGHVGIDPATRSMTSLFPDPASDQLVVGTMMVLPCIYRIFTVDGQLLSTGVVTEHPTQTIDVSSLTEGIYLLNLTTAQGISSQRFIIAR